jgi:hypothetical protein
MKKPFAYLVEQDGALVLSSKDAPGAIAVFSSDQMDQLRKINKARLKTIKSLRKRAATFWLDGRKRDQNVVLNQARIQSLNAQEKSE